MTYKKVLKWPARRLLEECETVNNFDENLKSLIVDMIDTCNVDNGIGIAANQIGDRRRVIVVKPSSFGYDNGDSCSYNSDFMVLVNPTLKNSGDLCSWQEACLSIPGVEGRVQRAPDTVVKYQTEDGETKTLIAEWPLSGGIQHECDHLDGQLFISKMSRGSRSMAMEKFRKREKKKAREARRQEKELRNPKNEWGR